MIEKSIKDKILLEESYEKTGFIAYCHAYLYGDMRRLCRNRDLGMCTQRRNDNTPIIGNTMQKCVWKNSTITSSVEIENVFANQNMLSDLYSNWEI